MHSITEKSTGILIDERITAGFKLEAKPSPEIEQRIKELDTVIEQRVGENWHHINKYVIELERQLKLCWDAQEVVMHTRLRPELNWEDREDLYRLAVAGKTAQSTNAERNKLIRSIDTALGELNGSTLEKTYG